MAKTQVLVTLEYDEAKVANPEITNTVLLRINRTRFEWLQAKEVKFYSEENVLNLINSLKSQNLALRQELEGLRATVYTR